MEFREKQSEGKGFFLSVLDFIGALVLFFIFGCVAYGILIDDSFFGYLGNKISDLLLRFLAWVLEYIILPIAGVVGVIKGIIWIFSGETETIYEYEIPVKEEKNAQNHTHSPTPPLQNYQQKPPKSYDFTIKDLNESGGGGEKKYPQGSFQAIKSWETSEEKQALNARKAELERAIEERVKELRLEHPDFFED